jgi:mannosyl-oligosaccharide glucosidase
MKALWLLLPLSSLVYTRAESNDSSLLWGTYRPNLYFGLRPRLPQSLMTGLIWFGTQNYQSVTRRFH